MVYPWHDMQEINQPCYARHRMCSIYCMLCYKKTSEMPSIGLYHMHAIGMIERNKYLMKHIGIVSPYIPYCRPGEVLLSHDRNLVIQINEMTIL